MAFNKPEFDRMLEKEKEAMANQVPNNLFGMLGTLVGAGKQPGGQEKEGEAAAAAAAGGRRGKCNLFCWVREGSGRRIYYVIHTFISNLQDK